MTSHSRATKVGGCFAALAALLASLIVTAPAQATPGPPALVWGECPSPPEGRSEEQECAVLRVPLDYHRPNGGTITLTVSRLATSVPHLRRGEREVRDAREQWPLTNGMPANVFACAYWRGPVPEPVQVRPTGPANVLIVQSLRDPGTPYPGALSLLEAFGDRARMLALNAGQHGVSSGRTNAVAACPRHSSLAASYRRPTYSALRQSAAAPEPLLLACHQVQPAPA